MKKSFKVISLRGLKNSLFQKEKRLIGWDEILEGGLAPEATVMSWRGTNRWH